MIEIHIQTAVGTRERERERPRRLDFSLFSGEDEYSERDSEEDEEWHETSSRQRPTTVSI